MSHCRKKGKKQHSPSWSGPSLEPCLAARKSSQPSAICPKRTTEFHDRATFAPDSGGIVFRRRPVTATLSRPTARAVVTAWELAESANLGVVVDLG
jgi:hypothetical protein